MMCYVMMCYISHCGNYGNPTSCVRQDVIRERVDLALNYLTTQSYGELLIESILFGEFLLIKRSERLGGGDGITKINTDEGDVY